MRVNVSDETGRIIGTVDESEVGNLPPGVRVSGDAETASFEREKEYGGIGGMAAAAGLGALSTTTFGLSDQAIAAAGGQSYLQGVYGTNPLSTTVGKIGGALVPFLGAAGRVGKAAKWGLGAPLSAAYELGAVGERALGGGLIGAAGRAAFEGAAFAGGEVVSENAVYDTPITGERLFSEMGQGALLGGAAGAGVFGIGKGLSLTGKMLGKVGSALKEPAINSYAKVLAVTNGVDEAVVQKVLRAAPRDILAADASKAGFLERLAKAADEMEFARAAAEESLDTATLNATGRTKYTPPGGEEAALAKASEALETAAQAIRPEYRGAIDAVTQETTDAYFKASRTLGNPVAGKVSLQEGIQKAKAALAEDGRRLFPIEINAAEADLARWKPRIAEPPAVTKDALGQRALTADERASFLEQQHIAAGQERAALVARRDGLLAAQKRNLEARAQLDEVLSDAEMWGTGSAVPRKALAPRADYQAVSRDLRKFVDTIGTEDGTTARAALLDRVSQLEEQAAQLEAALNLSPEQAASVERMRSAAKTVRGIVEADEPIAVANAYQRLEKSSRGGFFRNFVAGSALTGNLTGLALAPVMNPAHTMRQVAAVRTFAEKAESKLEGGFSGLFKRAQASAIKTVPRIEQGVTDHGKRAFMVRQTMQRLPELERQARAGYGQIAYGSPKAVEASVSVAMRFVEYLNKTMPRSALGDDLIDDWSKSQWKERIDAASDPSRFLDQLNKQGTISMNAAEAIQAVHPLTFEHIQTTVTERAIGLQEKGKALPYADRAQLTLALDVPLEPTFHPENLWSIQEAYAAEPPMDQPPTPRSQSGPGFSSMLSSPAEQRVR